MKHVLLLLFVVLACYGAVAQADPLNYYVVLKDSTAFNCKIPYRKQGQIIKAVKPDSTEAYIVWARIDTIYLVRIDGSKVAENSVSGTELKKIRQSEELAIKKKTWVPCVVVLFSGDTIVGIADPGKDYGAVGSYNEWSKEYWWVNEISIETNENTIKTYRLAQVKEIELTDSAGVVKYFNVKGDMFKVIVDGTIKLLRRHKLPDARNALFSPPVLPANVADGSYTWGPTGGYVMGTESMKFFLYKSGQLYELKTQTGLARATDDFIEDCETLFEGCPVVIERIKALKGRNVNLKSVTEEYNVCIKQ